MSADEIRQRTQAVWDRFYSLKFIWQRSRFLKTLRSRLTFILISEIYRQIGPLDAPSPTRLCLRRTWRGLAAGSARLAGIDFDWPGPA